MKAKLFLLRLYAALCLKPQPPLIVGDEPSPPFIAREDFEPGDRLVFMGDSLFRWHREFPMEPAFLAKRTIKAGESVRHDPEDLRGSDLVIIWWDEKGRRRRPADEEA